MQCFAPGAGRLALLVLLPAPLALVGGGELAELGDSGEERPHGAGVGGQREAGRGPLAEPVQVDELGAESAGPPVVVGEPHGREDLGAAERVGGVGGFRGSALGEFAAFHGSREVAFQGPDEAGLAPRLREHLPRIAGPTS